MYGLPQHEFIAILRNQSHLTNANNLACDMIVRLHHTKGSFFFFMMRRILHERLHERMLLSQLSKCTHQTLHLDSFPLQEARNSR